MKILSWNVNGIRTAQKKGFLDWLKAQDAEIVCVQETKAQQDQLDDELKDADPYVSYWNSAEKKGYSGVCVYSKIRPKEMAKDFGDNILSKEGRVIMFDLKDFKLFNVYFPNGKMSQQRLDYKLEFYDEFLKYLIGLLAKGEKIIVCGDFNTAHKEIDLARPKENRNISGFMDIERKWIDKFIKAGFIDTFREFNKKGENYTYWDMRMWARDRNIGWRIDYFFISKNLKPRLNNAFILPDVMGSDHCPIGIEIET